MLSARYFSLIDMIVQLNELKVLKAIELLQVARQKSNSPLPIPIADAPSEDLVPEENSNAVSQTEEIAEAKLEEATRVEKDFFLLLFQRFVMLIGSLNQQGFSASGLGEADEEEPLLNIAVGRMMQVARSHWAKISQFVDSLDSLVFFGEVGPAKQAFELVKQNML